VGQSGAAGGRARAFTPSSILPSMCAGRRPR
jgi:hypothetical protein